MGKPGRFFLSGFCCICTLAIYFMISLRKVLFSVFGAVAALLAIVVILGLLQYRFTREYDSIIYQGEKILFRFHSLREHLTRIMIVGTAIDAEAVSGKVDA